MFIEKNPNPSNRKVGDCVVRAIALTLDQSWDRTYIEIAIQGLMMGDMPSSNSVWGAYLQREGFSRYAIPNTCPECYTVGDFCADNPVGTYILGTGTHVVAVKDGNYYDSWDSGDEVPVFFFRKEEE